MVHGEKNLDRLNGGSESSVHFVWGHRMYNVVHTLLNTCHHCAGSSTGIKWDSKSFNDLVKHSGGQPFRRHRRCVPSLCSVQGLNKMQNIYSLCTQTVHTNFEIHMKWCHKRTLESIKRCKQTKRRKEFN